MEKTKATLLLHPVFLASLLLLLLNDHWWKYDYPSWFTGKLSDVAGLVVLPVFLRALFPAHHRKILIFTALFFSWWKSPLSEPLIVFVNANFSIPLVRVVDYTDLFALAVLPIAAKLKPVRYSPNGFFRPLLRAAAGLLAFVSLCSTSVGYRYGLRYDRRENRTAFYLDFDAEKSEEEIIDNLKRKGLAVRKDSLVHFRVLNADKLYYRVSGQTDSNLVWKPVPQSADSAIYLLQNVGPYYLIPALVLDGDTLKNLEFTTYGRRGRPLRVTIESFETTHPEIYQELSRRKRKPFKAKFEAIFMQP